MGQTSDNPYTSQSISGYNSSPPPDDASVQSSNKLEWAKHKTKLADPVKTLTEAVNTQVLAMGTLLINTATGVRNQMSGSLGFAHSTATIEGDVFTPDASAVRLGAESGATGDFLHTIGTDNVYDGAMLYLRPRHATEEITLVHATSTKATATNPNIYLVNKSTVTLDDPTYALTLQYESNTASGWVEVSNTNGAPLQTIASATADTTLSFEANNKLYDVDTSDGDVTLTLPSAPSRYMRLGARVSDNTNNLVFSGNGNTINGATQEIVSGPRDAVDLYWDNAEWHMTRKLSSAGRFDLLEAVTATGVSSIVFAASDTLTSTGYSDYENLVLEFVNISPSAASVLEMTVRNATEATFNSSGYRWSLTGSEGGGGTVAANGATAGNLQLTDTVSNGSNALRLNSTLFLYGAAATTAPYASFWSSYGANATDYHTVVGGGTCSGNTNVAGVTVNMSAGNLNEGTVLLWGERKQ